ncbi:nucleolar protein 7-like [Anabas testudineus]|uniref:U3 small nucleolar RNA-associated protein NOL7 C-terminal domain-containing protein n=1 Tax=Anabas testudineus TaxID=64144 RepID=A0A3Q1JW76_ANATE|nr:nucleolar protein 7-like [Anabas testudineus]
MAKKQRGKTSSPLKAADGEKQTENFSLMLDSSDDEAPEEVTFGDSKAQALQSLKEALDTAKREKALLKEKRRKRQELFQEQKKRKLLPADVLEEIDSAPSKKQKQSEDEAEDEQQEDEEEEEGERRKKKKRKLAHSRNLKGKYTVKTVKEQASASYQQQEAEDFIRSRLYGPGSCRTTNNELLSLQNKKGMNKSAAVQFVKKDWASKEKAKAEKMKKRWIHKQQIPSC